MVSRFSGFSRKRAEDSGMCNKPPTSIVPRRGFPPNIPELDYTNPRWKLSWQDGQSPGAGTTQGPSTAVPVPNHRGTAITLPSGHTPMPKALWWWPLWLHACVWQKGHSFHFLALSFIRVQFCPEHKGRLVSEGQVGREVQPYLGNPFQMRRLTLGAGTPSGGAVISASTGIPALITTSVGIPALGAGPALAPSFGGTLLLFALQSFWRASLCVLMGVTSAGFLHLVVLGFIISHV